MKILYLDFLYPKGHVRQNTTYIGLLSKMAEVYVLALKGHYKSLPSRVNLIEKDYLKVKDGKVMNRLSSLKVMFLSAITARKLKPNYVFVASYETIMFAIGILFFSKKDNIFLLHHFNIDELQNGIKRWFFKKYMKKVNHIVFDDFIKRHLIENYNLDEQKIFVIPHQLNENLSTTNNNKYSCVGLSNSNDERVIAEIVDKEKRKEVFKKAQCKVVLKSKNIKFDNGFLKVVNNYLDDNEYNGYIDNTKCVYMPFPSSFCYRMSGTLVDALSNNKIVLGSDIILINFYSKKYPEICKVIKDSEDFSKYVIAINQFPKNEKISDFEKFKNFHSEDKIRLALMKMFC